MHISGELGVVKEPEFKTTADGKAWVRIRAVYKSPIKDSNGNWTDGPPLWLSVVAFGKHAEHITDSVTTGDSIMVDGELQYKEYTNAEGEIKPDITIKANSIGVGVKWNPAKTPRMLGESKPRNEETPHSDDAPF